MREGRGWQTIYTGQGVNISGSVEMSHLWSWGRKADVDAKWVHGCGCLQSNFIEGH